MLRHLLLLETALLFGGALWYLESRRQAAEAPRAAMRAVEEKPSASADSVAAKDGRRDGRKAQEEPPPLLRCFPTDSGGSPPRPLADLLDRSADRFDAEDFTGSLACAEEAARSDPRSVEGHHDRAAALQELGRLDEARDAFARALALDPDDPETLAGAADLYINRLPPSADHSETGLELARRGSARARRIHPHGAPRGTGGGSPGATPTASGSVDRSLLARLALLEGQAQNDLGRSREALSRLDAAAAVADPGSGDEQRIRYERATALFELCRFADAQKGFLDVLQRSADDAWAHHHLGLALERLGDRPGAERELATAMRLAPNDFRAPVMLTPAEFRALVDAEVARLPARLADDLRYVRLETADLPDLDDLSAEEPPLSPTILGLFRGAPLGDPSAGDEPRTIVVYRENLGRAVATREELAAQVRTTLLHELGHLRGEDDEALRARGLE